MLGPTTTILLLVTLSSSSWLMKAGDAFLVQPAHQQGQRRRRIFVNLDNNNSNLRTTTKAKETDDDDWELADGISEPVPTTVETFLSKKFPEFFFLLSKNEDALKVIRQEKDDQSSSSGGGITFFAPSSDAFQNLGTKKLQQLEDERNLETVQKIGAYHVVPDEALQAQLLFTEDWTQGRPKDGSKPVFTVEGIKTLGDGVVPVGRSKTGGFFGFGGVEDGDPVLGTSNSKIVRSYFVGKDRKCIVHEMDGFVSPELLWRYMDQLRIPGF